MNPRAPSQHRTQKPLMRDYTVSPWGLSEAGQARVTSCAKESRQQDSSAGGGAEQGASLIAGSHPAHATCRQVTARLPEKAELRVATQLLCTCRLPSVSTPAPAMSPPYSERALATAFLGSISVPRTLRRTASYPEAPPQPAGSHQPRCGFPTRVLDRSKPSG